MVQQAVDRLFSYMVFQEQHLLQAMHTEAAKARIMGELAVNHLLSLITQDGASFSKQQQQDQQYLLERLQSALKQSPPKPDPPST